MAGTLVWVLPSGANPKETPSSKAIAKPIEEVQVGEWVLTREEGTGKVGWAPVVRVHKRWVAESELVVVKAGGEKLKVTKEHPFYVVGQGWEMAGELKSGEKLVGAEGNLVAIEGVEPFKVRGPPHFDKRVAVYNLTVFGTQTYFVGKEKVWVHNRCVFTLDELENHPPHGSELHWQKIKEIATAYLNQGHKPVAINVRAPGVRIKPDIRVDSARTVEEVAVTHYPDVNELRKLRNRGYRVRIHKWDGSGWEVSELE